jgi:hypothetical protein
VKSKLYYFEFFKTKNTQSEKILKNHFGILQMGSNHKIFFIFDLAVKKHLLAHAQHALTQKF